MRYRKPDIGRIKTFIGWEPKILLSETLARVINHFRNQTR